jgi:hypothetical protein
LYTNIADGLAHIVELEGFYYRGDEFHPTPAGGAFQLGARPG